ncbi:unnamed protein product [Bursaphelenchus xylophilus]|nr:unnamed protein product [Bursaphelenchus xylophilus]CAG9092726.1 unnamed protein product [Bursaphelenchus xylophilus]
MSDDPLLEKTIRDKIEIDSVQAGDPHAHKPSEFYAPYLTLPYYHGLVTKPDVPELLGRGGEFMLRFACPEVSGQPMKPVLSIHPVGGDKESIVHVEVKVNNGKYSVDSSRSFDTIESLVNHYQSNKESIPGHTSAMLNRPAKRHRWQLRNNMIKVERKIGAGSFAQVFLCIMRSRNREREVAVKICHETPKLPKEEMMKEVMREVRIMKPLKHKNVVRLFGVAMDYEPIMIVMEYVRGGSLQRYLRKNSGRVSPLDKLEKMIVGAGRGLEYVHSMKLIHRDIAARNCLFDKETCKISDFGLTRSGESYKLVKVRKVPYKNMAPEVYTTFKYTPASDVYAFGVMAWEIWMDGKEPFLDKKLVDVKSMVLAGTRLEFSPSTPSDVVHIVTDYCWNQKPEDRQTMSFVVRKMEEATLRMALEISKSRADNTEEDVEPGMPMKSTVASIINREHHEQTETECETSMYDTRTISSNDTTASSSSTAITTPVGSRKNLSVKEKKKKDSKRKHHK